MEILHIIPAGGSHIIPLAEQLYLLDKENTHNFFVTIGYQAVLKINIELLGIRNLITMPSFGKFKNFRRFRYFISVAKKADRIVCHSFTMGDGYIPYILYLYPSLLKKTTWIPAEGEIDNYVSVRNKFLNRFAQRVNHYVQHNVSEIGIHDPVVQNVLKNSKIEKPAVCLLPYVLTLEQQLAFQKCKEKSNLEKKSSAICIQIGLNSQRNNQHKHLLDVFCNLSDCQNAWVFIPFRNIVKGMQFGPGTKVYMNRVRAESTIIGSRTVFIDRFCEPNSYSNLLSSMDIVLLANKDSCQWGTLLCLLEAGKRIFIDKESPLYYYLNELGANVYSLEKLEEIGSLQSALELPGSKLPQQLEQEYDNAQIVAHWKQWSQIN